MLRGFSSLFISSGRATTRSLKRAKGFRLATMSSQATDMKEIAVMNASDLKDGQHKAVDFLDGKVLLSKIKGEVYATSAFCTHYGAPLEKGVLSHDGRVVCPWHGACFNVCTGDIEDAPGLDSLWKYNAVVKDGKIVVQASEKEVKSKVGRVVSKAKDMKNQKDQVVVIVGGGSGAIHTIESLRLNDFAGKIVVISEENAAPFDRTKMSKALIDSAEKLQWRSPEELKNDFSVDFHAGTSVTKVDSKAQTVTTSSGSQIKYDHLVLAPGGAARKLPIDGANLDGVMTLRHLEDTKKIVSSVNKDSEIVIIGTSFIGMEVGVALLKKEPKSVTLVGVDKIPFAGILGEEIGKAIMENMKSQGIKFYMEAGVEKVLPSDSDSSHCGAVQIKGHDPLPATLVIMGTGVAPATGFLKESGFSLEKDGGITVDENLRISGEKNVYAIGDIAHYVQYPAKNKRRVEHWNVAGNQGRMAAHNISKPHDQLKYTKVPVFWSSIGKGLRYVGTGEGFDDIHNTGNVNELKFVSYQAKKGQITAVSSMQSDPYVAKASELMRLGIMPSMKEIKDGKNILEIELIGKA